MPSSLETLLLVISAPESIVTLNPTTLLETLADSLTCPDDATILDSMTAPSSITESSQMYEFKTDTFFPMTQFLPMTDFLILVPSPTFEFLPMATDVPILHDCASNTFSSL